MSSNCWTIAVKPGINLDIAFCTAASVAFPLSEMLRHMIGSTFGTCKLSTLDGLMNFFRSFFTSSDCPTDRKPSFATFASPLSIARPDFSVPLKTNFNSFRRPSSDLSSEASSPSDKILSNSFELKGCCVSGIWCVSSFDTSMSESSPFSLSFLTISVFTHYIPFTWIPITWGGPPPPPPFRSKSPTREHKSVIPRWMSRNIGSCLIIFCKLSKTVGDAITGTWSELALRNDLLSQWLLHYPPAYPKGNPTSTIVQIWRIALQNAAHSVLWPLATRIRKYFTEAWLNRLFEKWVTTNYSKTKDIKVPKVCNANNAQRTNNAQSPSKNDYYACPNRITAPFCGIQPKGNIEQSGA